MKIEIAHQDIAIRAYLIYKECGGHHGCDLHYWLLAENQLKNEHLDARSKAEVIPAVSKVSIPTKI